MFNKKDNKGEVQKATRTLKRLRTSGNTTYDSVQKMRANLQNSHSEDETEIIIRNVLDEDAKH
jgi:hypothetical protein